jgi:DNA repair protein RecN (Recombination protein N)
MLIKLSVQNYALIKELDISLDNGLTVITGETGAGKTIILGALSLILGSRADTGVLLDKSTKCVVEGTFNIKDYSLKDFFDNNELDYDPLTILRREINPAGKSRAFINDTPVNLNILKNLGDRLIDIHSQHQTLMLSESQFQLNVIDSFAGNNNLRQEYRNSYNAYNRLKKEYDDLRDQADRNKADLEYYQHQLEQLEVAKLRSGEQEELEKEQEILIHAGEIKMTLEHSSSALSSDETSVLNLLRDVKQNIGKITGYLSECEELMSRFESSYIELDDLADEIEKLALKIESDPERLAVINERLDLLYSLLQKHRVKTIDELIEKHEHLKKLVETIVTSDERMDEMEELLDNEIGILRKRAEEMSSRRKMILSEMEKKITEILRQLGMPNARFRVEMGRSSGFTTTGTDKADFLFSANKQVPPENISQVASGGELSRVMLSLKSLLSKNINLPTIIFDEIDSGVSGEVADKVGQILAEMGESMQVINITHLPQVAARGKGHYHVFKDEGEDSTITRIKLLTAEERILEVAKLLSGSEVTDSAVKNAIELLQAAER